MGKKLFLLAFSVLLSACALNSSRLAPSQLVGQPRDAVVRGFGKPARVATEPKTGRETLVYWDRLLEKPGYRHWSSTDAVEFNGTSRYAAYYTVVFVLDAEGRVASYRLEDEKPYTPREVLPGAWPSANEPRP